MFIPFFLIFAGFVIGLGAVTVIDLHGFLARNSSYWTEATIRTHKVTKPLIWIGMLLLITGGILLYKMNPDFGWHIAQLLVAIVMVLNGCFLSFYVSPFLLKQEQSGQSKTLLPNSLKLAISVSFIISVASWWGQLVYFLHRLTQQIS